MACLTVALPSNTATETCSKGQFQVRMSMKHTTFIETCDELFPLTSSMQLSLTHMTSCWCELQETCLISIQTVPTTTHAQNSFYFTPLARTMVYFYKNTGNLVSGLAKTMHTSVFKVYIRIYGFLSPNHTYICIGYF